VEDPGTRSEPRTRFGAAALLLAASVLLSRGLGYVREAVLALRVGVSAEADAYRAGFQIPDLLNYFLAGGALSVAFVPLYTRARARGGLEARRLYATVLGTLGASAVLATAILWWQAEALVGTLFPRFEPDKQALTVHLTRIVLPAQIFFVTGAIVRAALMAEGRFGAQAAAPILYNGCIIAGGLFLAPTLGVEGFAWGALVGAFLGPFLVGLLDARGRVPLAVRFAPFDRDFLRYLVVAAPLMIGLSLLVVDEWYERIFGGLLGDGVVAQLGYARQLMLVPVAIVGQALAAAALPFMSRLWSENRGAELDALVLRSVRLGAALAVISGAALVVFAEPAVRVVYERGRFGGGDTTAVAGLLAVLALACPSWVVQQIVSRAFYARGDTWRPMLLATGMAVAMIPLYLGLGERYGALGIAWAGVVGITANALATLLLARRLHGAPPLRPLLSTFLRSVGIAAVAAFVAQGLVPGGAGLVGAFVDLVLGGVVFSGLIALGARWVGDAAMRDGLQRLVARVPGLRRRASG
jgi:putative peptidoglycan lipid II flippase